MTYMGNDKSAARLVRLIRKTCGKNAIVVHTAVTLPIIVILFILSYSPDCRPARVFRRPARVGCSLTSFAVLPTHRGRHT
jgi:hypothetical protein